MSSFEPAVTCAALIETTPLECVSAFGVTTASSGKAPVGEWNVIVISVDATFEQHTQHTVIQSVSHKLMVIVSASSCSDVRFPAAAHAVATPVENATLTLVTLQVSERRCTS